MREARPRRRRLGRRLETHVVDLSRLPPGALPASLARSPLADPVDPPIATAALADPPPTPAMAEALRGFLLRQLATLATLPDLRHRPDGSWRKLTWELRARVLEGEGGGDDVEDAGWIDVRGEEEVIKGGEGGGGEEGAGGKGEVIRGSKGNEEGREEEVSENEEDSREAAKAEFAGDWDRSVFAPEGASPLSSADAEGGSLGSPRYSAPSPLARRPSSPPPQEPSALPPHPPSPPLRKPALASPLVASLLWPTFPEASGAPFDGRPGSLPTEGATWVASQEETANGEGQQGDCAPLPATQPLPDRGEQGKEENGKQCAPRARADGGRQASGASRRRSSPTLGISSSAPSGRRSSPTSPGRALQRSPKSPPSARFPLSHVSPHSPRSPASAASPRSPRSRTSPPLDPPLGLHAYHSPPSRRDPRARESPASRRLLSGPPLPSSPALLTQAAAPDSPAFLGQPSPPSPSSDGSPERKRVRRECASEGEEGHGGRAPFEPSRDPDSPVLAQRPPDEEEGEKEEEEEEEQEEDTWRGMAKEGGADASFRDLRRGSSNAPRSAAPSPSAADALAIDLFRGSTQRALEARARGGLGRVARGASGGPPRGDERGETLAAAGRAKRKRESSPDRLVSSSQTPSEDSPSRPSDLSRASSPRLSLPSSLESLPSPASSSPPSQIDLVADCTPPSQTFPDLDATPPSVAAAEPGIAPPSQASSSSSSSASWPSSSSSSSSSDDDAFPAKTLVPIRSAAVPPYWRLQLYVLREPDADE